MLYCNYCKNRRGSVIYPARTSQELLEHKKLNHNFKANQYKRFWNKRSDIEDARIKVLQVQGVPIRLIAYRMGCHEDTIRYRLKRMERAV